MARLPGGSPGLRQEFPYKKPKAPGMWAELRTLAFPLPRACLWCGRTGSPELCDVCYRELVARPGTRCPRCLRPLDLAAGAAPLSRAGGPGALPRCWNCRVRPPAFAGLTCLGLYRGLLRWTVNAVKGGGERFLLPPVADILARRLWEDGAAFDVVTAPPPDPRRLRRRGFHPALVLADQLAARTRRPYDPNLLRRVRAVPPQSSLTGTQRRRNLRGAVAATAAARRRLAGRRVLLVDDVITTGSTLDAAARALLAAGAASVWAAVVADNGRRRAPP